MTSGRPEGNPRRLRRSLLSCPFLFMWLLFAAMPGLSAAGEEPGLSFPPRTEDREAWLVTIAPGEVYWQRFGHNAIWLREPARGLDHTFNFGYFDFDQENFFLRFLTGRMLYQSLAFDAGRELAGYAAEGRSIRAQKLNLSTVEYERLRDHLVWHVQPANRDYLYDYYLDNCSTRIRDAIDGAVGGALSSATDAHPAQANFRAHTGESTRMTFWYYLGLQAVLGRPVDRDISRWDEMFLPGVVAETVGALGAADGNGPLVTTDHRVFAGGIDAAGALEWPSWARSLLVSVLLIALTAFATRGRDALRLKTARGWLGLVAVLGVVIALLWALTDHRVVGPNANLLLLNPLFLLLLGPMRARILSVLVVLGGVGSLAQWWLLGWQYNIDVVALVWPLSVAATWVLGGFSSPKRA